MGQVTTRVSGGMAGRYPLTAFSADKAERKSHLTVEEIALGYPRLGPPLHQ